MIKQPKSPTPAERPTTRKLIIIRGRGTPNEQRIETDVTLYWDRATGLWMSIPADRD